MKTTALLLLIAAGRDKVLMETNDAGRTWVQTPTVVRRPLFSEDPFNDVVFGDSVVGISNFLILPGNWT